MSFNAFIYLQGNKRIPSERQLSFIYALLTKLSWEQMCDTVIESSYTVSTSLTVLWMTDSTGTTRPERKRLEAKRERCIQLAVKSAA